MIKTFTAREIKRIMAAYEPEAREPEKGMKPASVLIPFYPDPENLSVIFTKRTNHLPSHSGQISFPGGGRDPEDEDDLATALRETHEEIGVEPDVVETWGGLNPETTVGSGYWVSPFVGIIPFPYEFKLNTYEVARLVIVPLSHLLDPANVTSGMSIWEGREYRAFEYTYGRDVIWGATARMLNNFLNLLTTGREHGHIPD